VFGAIDLVDCAHLYGKDMEKDFSEKPESGAEGRAQMPALAGSGRGAQRRVDLSLGHFGTSKRENPEHWEDSRFGPFTVSAHLPTRTVWFFVDKAAFTSRQERRSAEREFMKASLRYAAQCNFTVPDPRVWDMASEDEQ
jgi:hypothetical protein